MAGTSVPALRFGVSAFPDHTLASSLAATTTMTTAARATQHLLTAAAVQTEMTAAVVAPDMMVSDSAMAPAAPADRSTPSETAAQMPAASIEAGSAPAVRVPAVLVATVKVLGLLDGAECIGGLSETGERHRLRLDGEDTYRGGEHGQCEAFPHSLLLPASDHSDEILPPGGSISRADRVHA
jgi:hypothetical protein